MFDISKIIELIKKILLTIYNITIKSIESLKQKKTIDLEVIVESRKFVSKIILEALTEKCCVRDALLKFPPESTDPSIQTAWKALCYLEADEDIRKKDKDYAQEQNDYIEMIAFTLQKGDELPKNIINAYTPYKTNALIPHSSGIKGVISKLTKFLNI